MEKYISQDKLNLFYTKELKSLGKKGIIERVETSRNDTKSDKSKRTIFFSHSHIDRTIVPKIGLLFDKLHTELYIDWMDKSLPSITDKQTATTIKAKIKNSHKFLFLATYHGLRSKWCNWEIGIADSVKGDDNLAILPIQTKSGSWKGNEYLQLYPEMKIETENLDLLTVDMISIHLLNGDTHTLKEWLNL